VVDYVCGRVGITILVLFQRCTTDWGPWHLHYY